MSPMNLAAFYQACEHLIDTGWTIPQIEQLCHFRDSFQRTSMDMRDLNLDIRHLEFIRWMVQTGRMTDW